MVYSKSDVFPALFYKMQEMLFYCIISFHINTVFPGVNLRFPHYFVMYFDKFVMFFSDMKFRPAGV
jgi:hypothetical protein